MITVKQNHPLAMFDGNGWRRIFLFGVKHDTLPGVVLLIDKTSILCHRRVIDPSTNHAFFCTGILKANCLFR